MSYVVCLFNHQPNQNLFDCAYECGFDSLEEYVCVYVCECVCLLGYATNVWNLNCIIYSIDFFFTFRFRFCLVVFCG